MKINVLQSLLFTFLIVACTPETTIAVPTIAASMPSSPTELAILLNNLAPTNEENVAATKQASNELCQSVGYERLAGFYPNVYYSPNGELSFVLCENYLDGKTFYPFVISSASNSQPVDNKQIIIAPDWIAKFPSTTFKPDLWNNGTLIFRAFTLPCPESFLCLYSDGEALYDVNLESGEFSTLLDPQITSSYAFSVSPDGKYLGYANQATPEEVYIRDLSSGKENKILLQGKFLKVGAFVWTPNSKEILFFGISYTNELFYSSLLLFDRTNSSLSVLFDYRSGTYFPGDLSSNKSEYWYQPDILYLGSVDSPHLYINIRTKEITQIPTSQP